MKTPLRTSFLALLLLAPASLCQAFPPAPSYTLYGTVRDQVGQRLDVEGAALVLLKGAVEIGRTPIQPDRWLDQNYQLKIRIDADRPGTAIYSEAALAAGGLFDLVVEMNGSLFYPIEASGALAAGRGGEAVRLDLNLGEDSDTDGLPDVWEEWQLFQAGHLPGAGGWDLSLIDREGDFDGDGQSNHAEYLAGTFAGDAGERFDLAIKDKAADHMRFEIYAITGKTYTIEAMVEGGGWERIDISPETDGERAATFTATTVGPRSLYCDPAEVGTELFRLTVR